MTVIIHTCAKSMAGNEPSLKKKKTEQQQEPKYIEYFYKIDTVLSNFQNPPLIPAPQP